MSKPIMYHISDRLDWRIGDTLICGEKYNHFWTVCATLDPVTTILGESMTYFELFDKCNALDPAQVDLADLYKNLKDISKECAFYIREQVFEDVRKQYYPDRPSRQTCLWVTEADQLSYWKTMNENIDRSILTLELDGELFLCDDYWLKANTFSSVKYTERAHQYWSGKMSVNPHKEVLFHGKATILNIDYAKKIET